MSLRTPLVGTAGQVSLAGAALAGVVWLISEALAWLDGASNSATGGQGDAFSTGSQMLEDQSKWESIASGALGWAIGLAILGAILLVVAFVLASGEEKAESTAREAAARKQAADAAATAKAQRLRRIISEIAECTSDAIAKFERMPLCLVEAESNLDEAQKDFDERALSPFWRNVEGATSCLGEFSDNAEAIERHARRYAELLLQYDGDDVLDAFPVALNSVNALKASDEVTTRMKTMIRAAERNPDFATIGEMRRTSAIMIAGFHTLGEAMDRMGNKISSGLVSLSASVSDVSHEIGSLAAATESHHGDIRYATERQHSELVSMNRTNSLREERAVSMLDDIRRGRKPLL